MASSTDEAMLLLHGNGDETTPNNGYHAFAAKFKRKATSDECYTPQYIYDEVLEYVRETTNIGDARIVRPFYPDLDYKQYDYSGDAVVVDNPPFSILAKIVRYFVKHGIRFFLFAPSLTLLSSFKEAGAVTFIVCEGGIKYANGANITTSFISNLYPDWEVICDPSLAARLQAVQIAAGQRAVKKKRLYYSFPPDVLTTSYMLRCVRRNIPFKLARNSVKKIDALDNQQQYGTTLFGGGYLVKRGLLPPCPEPPRQDGREVIALTLSAREQAFVDDVGGTDGLPLFEGEE